MAKYMNRNIHIIDIVIPTAPELMHGGRDRHTHSPRTDARRP